MIDLTIKADQRRVGAAARSSQGREHQNRGGRADIPDPKLRKRLDPSKPRPAPREPRTPPPQRRNPNEDKI